MQYNMMPYNTFLFSAAKHWQVKRITRPTDVPDTGLICDLLWADPDKAATDNRIDGHTVFRSWICQCADCLIGYLGLG